jgi:hypothetical protein
MGSIGSYLFRYLYSAASNETTAIDRDRMSNSVLLIGSSRTPETGYLR